MVVGIRAAGPRDPRYGKGLAHMQAGDWQEAIATFKDLLGDYPDSQAVQRALDDALFRQGLDRTARVRGKLVVIPWRQIVFGLTGLLIIAALGWMSWRLVDERIQPLVSELQQTEEVNSLQRACVQSLEAGQLTSASLATAEERCGELLRLSPDNLTGLDALDRIAAEREIIALYEEGVALYEAGDCQGVLAKFTELMIRRSQYRDVSLLIEACTGQLDKDALFAEVKRIDEAGDIRQAIVLYEQLRGQDITNVERQEIESRLFELRMALGREIVEGVPPPLEGLEQALEQFREALKLRPRDTEAQSEESLLADYLRGQSSYEGGKWEQAIGWLRSVYYQRPAYHRGVLVEMLYDAYIRSGNEYEAAANWGSAYNQYDRACKLDIDDKAACRSLLVQISIKVTPTFTPTPTWTPTPTHTPTPVTPSPTPKPPPGPTNTPAPEALSSLRGKIVFKVSEEYPQIESLQAEMWVMDPDGTNRRYLSTYRYYRDQYERIREQERYSPDGGLWRAYTTGSGKETQIWLMGPDEVPRQLTFLSGLNYDPVWSAGGRIAFVGQDRGGNDDIWVILPDGSGARALTFDEGYLWDKHPSWSKDGSRIVFWSNRTGNWQVFTMDAEGRDQRNISNTDQYEWDPIWIK